jgi:fructose-1,6-bisphosphatase/sedoheptulose 1,7-bisphosphatase-like protein
VTKIATARMVPRYVQLSLPHQDVVAIVTELAGIREADLLVSWSERERLVARLRAAIRGKGLRRKSA